MLVVDPTLRPTAVELMSTIRASGVAKPEWLVFPSPVWSSRPLPTPVARKPSEPGTTPQTPSPSTPASQPPLSSSAAAPPGPSPIGTPLRKQTSSVALDPSGPLPLTARQTLLANVDQILPGASFQRLFLSSDSVISAVLGQEVAMLGRVSNSFEIQGRQNIPATAAAYHPTKKFVALNSTLCCHPSLFTKHC